MDRDREHLLGVVLADDIVVEDLADLLRGRNIVARFRQQGLVLLADNVHAKLDVFVTNEDGRPGNELAHLVLAFAAERAVERVLRIATANLAHFRAALQDATALVNFERQPFRPIGHIGYSRRGGRRSSKSCLSNTSRIERLQACWPILMGYSTKRSNRHFLRATLSRSISSVNRTTVRHEFSIPALRSLATGRWAGGLHKH